MTACDAYTNGLESRYAAVLDMICHSYRLFCFQEDYDTSDGFQTGL